ncbi:hypothetical protein GCM10028791_39080 [Echinicola sediminis]
MSKRLAIVTTHPIQYNAPWFARLAKKEGIQLKVFYTWSQAEQSVKDRTFGKAISWDIPLLEGYDYSFVKNVSKEPGSHHKNGIICPTLIRELTDWKPDTVLVFGWYLKSHWDVMKYFKGLIPVWFRGDSTLLDEKSGLKTILRRAYLKRVYRHVDKALYVGQANKAYFLKHSLKPDQLIFAPHAIDNDRFKGENAEFEKRAKEWRQELGFSAKEIVILFAGKLEPKKQPNILIEAIKKSNLLRSEPLKLVLLGSGPLEKGLKELANGDENIVFLPFQNQSMMPIVYRLGDILCLPSKGPGETWGLAVNEAMACGRPVIVSDKVGCSQDLVKQGENGFVFPFNNPGRLKSILELLNRDHLMLMGKNAKVGIKEWHFDHLISSIEKELLKTN